jgi:methylaspartate ammonia-lyase
MRRSIGLLQRRWCHLLVVDEWCNTLDDIRAFADAEAADYAQFKTPDLGASTMRSRQCFILRRGWMLS